MRFNVMGYETELYTYCEATRREMAARYGSPKRDREAEVAELLDGLVEPVAVDGKKFQAEAAELLEGLFESVAEVKGLAGRNRVVDEKKFQAEAAELLDL